MCFEWLNNPFCSFVNKDESSVRLLGDEALELIEYRSYNAIPRAVPEVIEEQVQRVEESALLTSFFHETKDYRLQAREIIKKMGDAMVVCGILPQNIFFEVFAKEIKLKSKVLSLKELKLSEFIIVKPTKPSSYSNDKNKNNLFWVLMSRINKIVSSNVGVLETKTLEIYAGKDVSIVLDIKNQTFHQKKCSHAKIKFVKEAITRVNLIPIEREIKNFLQLAI